MSESPHDYQGTRDQNYEYIDTTSLLRMLFTAPTPRNAETPKIASNICAHACLEESRERPFLVDKRMVTQMLAAYLEQRENPGPQQELLICMHVHTLCSSLMGC